MLSILKSDPLVDVTVMLESCLWPVGAQDAVIIVQQSPAAARAPQLPARGASAKPQAIRGLAQQMAWTWGGIGAGGAGSGQPSKQSLYVAVRYLPPIAGLRMSLARLMQWECSPHLLAPARCAGPTRLSPGWSIPRQALHKRSSETRHPAQRHTAADALW